MKATLRFKLYCKERKLEICEFGNIQSEHFNEWQITLSKNNKKINNNNIKMGERKE